MPRQQTSPLLYRMLVILALVVGIAAIPLGPFPNPVHDVVNTIFLALHVKRGTDCPIRQTLKAAWHQLKDQDDGNRAESATRLLEKSPGGYELYWTPIGNFWIPAGNRESLVYLLTEIQRQPMREQVGSGDVVIDCGANIGFFTREALNAGASKVMAIDPMPENAECLRKTFSREISEGRVIVEEKAAWDVEESLDLSTIPENSEMSTVVLGKELTDQKVKVIKVRVQADRIDNMVKKCRLQRVNLIKMDIEGAERRALDGAALTVKTYKPRLSLAAYHLGDDVPMLTSLVARLRPDYVRSAGRCIINRGRCVPESLFFH